MRTTPEVPQREQLSLGTQVKTRCLKVAAGRNGFQCLVLYHLYLVQEGG